MEPEEEWEGWFGRDPDGRYVLLPLSGFENWTPSELVRNVIRWHEIHDILEYRARRRDRRSA